MCKWQECVHIQCTAFSEKFTELFSLSLATITILYTTDDSISESIHAKVAMTQVWNSNDNLGNFSSHRGSLTIRWRKVSHEKKLNHPRVKVYFQQFAQKGQMEGENE